MNIKLEQELVLSEHELALLRKTLNCKDDKELSHCLSRIGRSAMEEYLEMILGRQLPTRANEIYERRLFHLLKKYYIGRIPNEAEIAGLFQIKLSSSKTLLRNVKTKFKFDLEEEINNTIKDTLLNANHIGSVFRIVVQCENILEELQQTVSINAPQLDQITKMKGSAGVYTIPEDTFDLLADYYGVNVASIKAKKRKKGK